MEASRAVARRGFFPDGSLRDGSIDIFTGQLHGLASPLPDLIAMMRAEPAAVRTVLAAFLALAACGGDVRPGTDTAAARPPGAEARAIAVETDRRRATLAEREWTSPQGDAAATLTAFAAGDTLRLVRERLDRGESGGARNRYYFADGQLRYYESEGEVTIPDPSRASARRKERLVLAFAPGGTLVEGIRRLDGEIAPLDSVQIAGVRDRAEQIQRQYAANAPKPPTP